MRTSPHRGPVQATLRLYFSRQPRHRGMLVPLDCGDVDNHAKMILDAMNGVIYHDDRQVVSLVVQKSFCSPDDNPRSEIEFLLDICEEVESESATGKKRASTGKKRARSSGSSSGGSNDSIIDLTV